MPVTLAGVILAGGRARRMDGRDKAFLPLGGRPLLQHVIDRVAPQVATLALSVERAMPAYRSFGLPQLPDPVPGHHGPLGGLLAALRHFAPRNEWLLLAPCDAPFLPVDLGAVLHEAACSAAARCAMVRAANRLQPTFSLWHRELLADLERAVLREGQAGFREFVRGVAVAKCDWPPPGAASDPPPFFNINDPETLSEAARWLRQAPDEEHAECLP